MITIADKNQLIENKKKVALLYMSKKSYSIYDYLGVIDKYEFDERAGILELIYDRRRAEKEAYKELIEIYLKK